MKKHAPATARNREPILNVLRRWLPPEGVVLEIASGTGEHAAWFAPHFPTLIWTPSDRDAAARASASAWRQDVGAANLSEPLDLDVCAASWPIAAADAVFCANMIHIAPWAATQGLMQGAGRVLPPGGVLILYGPFMIDGAHTAPSNAAFDADLRSRDPRWGVRDLLRVGAAAQECGLDHLDTVPMPADNLMVVWGKRAGSGVSA